MGLAYELTPELTNANKIKKCRSILFTIGIIQILINDYFTSMTKIFDIRGRPTINAVSMSGGGRDVTSGQKQKR